jgi:O-antigen ligase
MAILVAALAAGGGVGLAAATLPHPTVIGAAVALGGVLGLMWFASWLSRLDDGLSLSPLARFGFALGVSGLVAVTLISVRIHGGLEVADALFVLAAGCLGMVAVVERRWFTFTPPYLVFSGSLLLASGVVAATANSGGGATSNLGKALEFAAALVFTPALVSALSSSPARLAVAGAAWSASVLINGIVALLDYTLNTGIGHAFAGRAYAGRQTGLTQHPNDLGIIAAMIVPYAIAQVAGLARTARARLFYAAVLASAAVGIMISGSRAALLATVVVVILAPVVNPALRNRVSGALLAVAVIVPAFVLAGATVTNPHLVALDRIVSLSSADNATNSTRIFRYSQALDAAAAHPLTGVGFSVVRYATNIYLQVLQAGGIPAIVAFLWFVFGTLTLGIRICRSYSAQDPRRILAAALMLSFGVWLIEGFVQNDIYNRYLFIPVGLLIGMEAERRRASVIATQREIGTEPVTPLAVPVGAVGESG